MLDDVAHRTHEEEEASDVAGVLLTHYVANILDVVASDEDTALSSLSAIEEMVKTVPEDPDEANTLLMALSQVAKRVWVCCPEDTHPHRDRILSSLHAINTTLDNRFPLPI